MVFRSNVQSRAYVNWRYGALVRAHGDTPGQPAGRIQAAIVPNAMHVKLRRDGLVPADAALVDVPEATPQQLGLYVNRQRVTAPMIVQLERPLAAMVSSGWVRQTYVRHMGEAETRRMYQALDKR